MWPGKPYAPDRRASHEDWTALIAEAGLGALIREDGALTLYRSVASRAAAWPLWQMLIERGATVERIDRDTLRALEPSAPAGYDCAVFEPDYRRTVDPYRICVGLADYLQLVGGTLRRENVSEVAPDGGRHGGRRSLPLIEATSLR